MSEHDPQPPKPGNSLHVAPYPRAMLAGAVALLVTGTLLRR